MRSIIDKTIRLLGERLEDREGSAFIYVISGKRVLLLSAMPQKENSREVEFTSVRALISGRKSLF